MVLVLKIIFPTYLTFFSSEKIQENKTKKSLYEKNYIFKVTVLGKKGIFVSCKYLLFIVVASLCKPSSVKL